MGFISSYVGLLKSRPLSTNLGTALVVMTAGDAMAQCVEASHVADDPEIESLPDNKRINLHRYHTVGVVDEHHSHLRSQHHHRDMTPNHQPFPSMWDDGVPSSSTWPDAIGGLADVASGLDGARSASMAGWSCLFYTPAYMAIYKFYDRVFPKRSAFTITSRVLGSIMFSIPINAAFFAYGTSVHHVIEWYSDGGTRRLDGRKMWADARLKIEAELLNTVERSAMMWLPINFVNFALVPPHLRPVVLTFCSVFWNCYLSLVQHRDMKMPEGYELELRGGEVGVEVEVDRDEVKVLVTQQITDGKKTKEEVVRGPVTGGIVVVAAERAKGGCAPGGSEVPPPSRKSPTAVAVRAGAEKSPSSSSPRNPPSILVGARLGGGGSALMASSSARPFGVATCKTSDDTSPATMEAPAATATANTLSARRSE